MNFHTRTRFWAKEAGSLNNYTCPIFKMWYIHVVRSMMIKVKAHTLNLFGNATAYGKVIYMNHCTKMISPPQSFAHGNRLKANLAWLNRNPTSLSTVDLIVSCTWSVLLVWSVTLVCASASHVLTYFCYTSFQRTFQQ